MTARFIRHLPVTLRPDPSRTVIRPFSAGYPKGYDDGPHTRAQLITRRILALNDGGLDQAFEHVEASLDSRHRWVDETLMDRFRAMEGLDIDKSQVSERHAMLIGAYFLEEYSFEAAALFNPSIVLHSDQEKAPPGGIRFGMSLRGIGEGHVSSVTFREGSWVPGGELTVDEPTGSAVTPRIEHQTGGEQDGVTRIVCEGSDNLSESVIFPTTPSQRQGIEDLRMTLFTDDDGSTRYLGTYTAFSGSEARPELLEGFDFRTFELRPFQGRMATAKGMALFPRRIDGRYVMLGRQDNENIWLMRSDNLCRWDEAVKVVEPRYPWEFVQMGNCGPPIELDEGWLVLTHGVGTVRNYCMGACLLDKADPAKLLARTPQPLIEPGTDERDGYVPNVVYSCGGLVHDRTLLLPYAVSDTFTTFCEMTVDDLLGAME